MVEICGHCGVTLCEAAEKVAGTCRPCQAEIASASFRRQYDPPDDGLRAKLDASRARVAALEAELGQARSQAGGAEADAAQHRREWEMCEEGRAAIVEQFRADAARKDERIANYKRIIGEMADAISASVGEDIRQWLRDEAMKPPGGA